MLFGSRHPRRPPEGTSQGGGTEGREGPLGDQLWVAHGTAVWCQACPAAIGLFQGSAVCSGSCRGPYWARKGSGEVGVQGSARQMLSQGARRGCIHGPPGFLEACSLLALDKPVGTESRGEEPHSR